MSIIEALNAVMADVQAVGKKAPAVVRYFGTARGRVDDCWMWPGATDRDGYGLCTIPEPKRTRGAHRVALASSMGVDVDHLRGQVVMHSCDTPPCVNPNHLSVGTQLENVRDMHEKDRANATRTHCLRGHELTDQNVYVQRSTGKRRCATCHRERQRAYDRKVRA